MLAKSRAILAADELPAYPPVKPAALKPPAVLQVSEPPRTSEVPKDTVSEKRICVDAPRPEPPTGTDQPINQADAPVERREQAPPRDLGRGGAQHQAIQQRIKQAAEGLGFRGVIEKPVLDGKGSVDLWLERAGLTIGCEISISNTIDYEVRNIAKCLKAGFLEVAMVCLDEERLQKIAAGVSGSLGPELAARVAYFHPDQFIAHLKDLPTDVPEETATLRHGYKIKRVFSELSTEKQKERETAAIRAIAEWMRKK
jgi:hypothetical protein